MSALAASLVHEAPAIATNELRALLSRALQSRKPRARIVRMERAVCPYGSSWWLEEVTLELSDASRIALVLKNLDREAAGSGSRRVKPAFVSDPAREPWVYEKLLIDVPTGPPALWVAVTDAAAGRYWLAIERVNGAPLSQVGDRAAWCAAAEWLGRFHATAPVWRAGGALLLVHDREYHRRWFRRALAAAREEVRDSAARVDVACQKLARLRALAPAHERAIERALSTASGPSLIHGEFYASNVLVEQLGASFAVHPVDWEMAALGPPLLDLAALLSGGWGQADRLAMATAYREGARAAGARSPALEQLLRDMAACRLLLAVQWLGWAGHWTAPPDHRNDWLEEAELCATELQG